MATNANRKAKSCKKLMQYKTKSTIRRLLFSDIYFYNDIGSDNYGLNKDWKFYL